MGATALIGGMVMGAGGKIAAGYSSRNALDASATEMTQEAGQSVASGIQGAIADRRRASYVAGNAQAKIAAGGLATTGITAETTIGGIKGQGDYQALTSLYQGADRASELNYRADQMRTEGSNAITAGWISGAGSVLSGGTSFYDKYGASA